MPLTKVDYNPAGEDLVLHFNVITNVLNGKDQFKAELKITNRGEYILKDNWSIYFNFLRMILPESVSPGFQVRHINGDYFCLEPTSDFSPLLPNSQVALEFIASFWAIKAVDAPVGFYIVFRDEEHNETKPVPLPPLTISPFIRPEQLRRTANDRMEVPTAESRFEANRDIYLLPKASLSPIMPTPYLVEKKENKFILRPSCTIAYQPHLKSEARYLADILGMYLGKPLESGESDKGTIRLSTARIKIGNNLENWNSEAYTMTVDTSGIDLVGTGAAAIFYAVQSLMQLLNTGKQDKNHILEVPCLHIKDKPQFAYRGMHLDVARNFHGVNAVKKFMDMMAFYKLNKFHFHLTDDEGWRIEIPGLPELTEIGGRRGHTYSETECLLPSYGSGCNPNDFTSAGNGFYNRQEFIELLLYAHTRHIQVIPAIDLPGHARAAVRAMEVRHDRYKASGDLNKANEYLLTDWDDVSEYESVQMWRRNVVDIGLESTYQFIEKVADELISMYAEADLQLSVIHIGGDEVPPGAWVKSPACLRLMRDHPEVKDVHDLAEYFIKRVSDILKSRGVLTAGWEEIALTHKNEKVNPNPALLEHHLMPYTWNTIWGEGSEEMPYHLANLGFKVILSNAPNLYFDFAYDKDPEEMGYYWGGYTDVKDTFKFLPLDLYKSAEQDALGNLIDPSSQYKNAQRLTQEGRANILGLQGQLWGETIRSAERIEYLLFPRMCALAERAWSKEPDWATISDPDLLKNAWQTDWNEFANRLGQIELPRLDRLFGGVHYRIPLAGAKLKNGLLLANVAFPGLTIRYTTDGTDPTDVSPVFEQSITVDSHLVKLKTFSSNGRHSSRTTVVTTQE